MRDSVWIWSVPFMGWDAVEEAKQTGSNCHLFSVILASLGRHVSPLLSLHLSHTWIIQTATYLVWVDQRFDITLKKTGISSVHCCCIICGDSGWAVPASVRADCTCITFLHPSFKWVSQSSHFLSLTLNTWGWWDADLSSSLVHKNSHDNLSIYMLTLKGCLLFESHRHSAQLKISPCVLPPQQIP